MYEIVLMIKQIIKRITLLGLKREREVVLIYFALSLSSIALI